MDAEGRAIFTDLEADFYQIEAILHNSNSYQGTAEVFCKTTTGIILEVHPQKMKRVP
jgi:hypothetical protein